MGGDCRKKSKAASVGDRAMHKRIANEKKGMRLLLYRHRPVYVDREIVEKKILTAKKMKSDRKYRVDTVRNMQM
jgi:hypothetical protein